MGTVGDGGGGGAEAAPETAPCPQDPAVRLATPPRAPAPARPGRGAHGQQCAVCESPSERWRADEAQAMYFAVGYPVTSALPIDEQIVSVQRSPTGAYFALLTAATVYIWSATQARPARAACPPPLVHPTCLATSPRPRPLLPLRHEAFESHG